MRQQQEISNHQETQDQNQDNQMRAFGVALVVFQIAITLIYTFMGNITHSYINISSIVIAILLAILTTVGFGLYFSYYKRLFWTGIGVTFLMTAISIQIYPLVNSLWTEAGIFDNLNVNFQNSNNENKFKFFLASFDNNLSTNNNISGAFRCAIALVVGCSGMLGRATPLNYLLFAILGAFTFEINRQVIANIGIDHFGSFTIFGFGGFASLGSGLIFCAKENLSKREDQLITSKTSAPLSLLGTLVIFLLIPILAFEGDGSMKRQAFTNYTTATCIILTMGAAVTTGIVLTLTVNGYIKIRDVQNCLVAGFVAGGTASYFITNPGFAIFTGGISAIIQIIFEYCVERSIYNSFGLYCTYPTSMFSVQSIVCFFFTSMFSDWTNVLRDGFNYSTILDTSNILASCFISVGIGFGTGLVSGLFCILMLPDDIWISIKDEQFWIKDDRIRGEGCGQGQSELQQKYAPAILDAILKQKKRKIQQQEQNKNKEPIKEEGGGGGGKLQKEQPESKPQIVDSDNEIDNQLKDVQNVEDLVLDFVDMLQVIE